MSETTETQRIHYTYDAIALTKMLWSMYVEQEIEGETYQARQFALYEYLRVVSDEDCEAIIKAYATQEGLTEITYSNWKEDCRIMFELIEKSEHFDQLLMKHRTAGAMQYSFEDHMGVSGILLPSGVFIQCGHQEHHLIADGIDWDEKVTSIYFSSPMRFGTETQNSGVISMSPFRKDEKKPNPKQNLWIDAHMRYFDKGQRDFITTLRRSM